MTNIEKYMLRWFSHVERMDERRLIKEIYEADFGGNAVRGRFTLTFLDQIGQV
jgi:nuclear transport factor 2 (NTF2) superfamily protein